MTPSKPSPLTRAEKYAVQHGVPTDVVLAANAAAHEHGLPLSRILAVGEAESGFRNVWGHDGGKWREDGPLTSASVRRYWTQPASRRPNGAGVWQLTYEPFQRRAEQAGGLHLIRPQASTAGAVIAGLPDRGGTAAGLARYNGTGPAAVAYGKRVHAREQVWHRILTTGS